MIHWLFTLSRLFITPFSVIAIKEKNLKTTLALIIYAIISDFLDGYFARKLNKTTNIGALADAITDKIFININAAAFYFYINHISAVKAVLVVWIIRDFALICLPFIKRKAFISIYSGKLYTALQFLFILVVGFNLILEYNIQNFMWIMAFIFTITGSISTYSYYKS